MRRESRRDGWPRSPVRAHQRYTCSPYTPPRGNKARGKRRDRTHSSCRMNAAVRMLRVARPILYTDPLLPSPLLTHAGEAEEVLRCCVCVKVLFLAVCLLSIVLLPPSHVCRGLASAPLRRATGEERTILSASPCCARVSPVTYLCGVWVSVCSHPNGVGPCEVAHSRTCELVTCSVLPPPSFLSCIGTHQEHAWHAALLPSCTS